MKSRIWDSKTIHLGVPQGSKNQLLTLPRCISENPLESRRWGVNGGGVLINLMGVS